MQIMSFHNVESCPFETLREYQDPIKWSIKITDHFTCYLSLCLKQAQQATVQATYHYGAKWSPVQYILGPPHVR